MHFNVSQLLLINLVHIFMENSGKLDIFFLFQIQRRNIFLK